MKEIEVGEYVRTKEGTIGKFKFYGKNDTSLIYFKTEYRQICVDDTEILKHSKNIIDLIEEGDYVNGEKIIEILDKNETYNGKKLVCSIRTNFGEEDIKTIVTKEQFKSVEYEVK